MATDSKKTKHTPPLNGLVLAGGKSIRMGTDKGLLDWHGKAQRYYLADMLDSLSVSDRFEVFISCRADQTRDIMKAGYKVLPDSTEAPGQYGAILSAMKTQPSSAWLVIACDIPLINSKALINLIRSRDSTMIATAYKNPENGLPEPLIAIWEPRAAKILLQKFSEGITCPRKALLGSLSEVKLIDTPTPEVIMNINTPESAKKVHEILSASSYVN